jgi:hypothetical protein
MIAGLQKIRPHHVVIDPKELLSKLIKVHGKSSRYNFYLWIRDCDHLALDGRGMSKSNKNDFLKGEYVLGARDYSEYIENWAPLKDFSY